MMRNDGFGASKRGTSTSECPRVSCCDLPRDCWGVPAWLNNDDDARESFSALTALHVVHGSRV